MIEYSDDCYFLLFSNCIPVKGAKRSILCDLQMSRYRFIPNLLYEIICNNRNKTIQQIKKRYKNKYNEGIDLFFNLLINEQWAFCTNAPEQFPPLDLNWDSPLKITNSIIDINNNSKYDVLKVIQQLSTLNCEAVQVRIWGDVNINVLKNISKQISESAISHSEFIFRYSNIMEEKELLELVRSNKRIRKIVVFNSLKEKTIFNRKTNLGIISYVKNNLVDNSCCGVVNEKYFSLNIQHFSESQKFNSCLNKKISIDVNGEIKNCPSMPVSYGNIRTQTLSKVVGVKDFTRYWSINKDQIEICKDCEFRYICTDCRAYTQNNLPLSKPQKCSYNPYEATWG